MNPRRLTLALGAALLTAGWGTIQYAKEQQAAVRSDIDTSGLWWTKGIDTPRLVVVPSSYILVGGTAIMALGAALVGGALLPSSSTRARPDEQPAS